MLNIGAISDDRKIAAFPRDPRFAKRYHIVRAGILRLVISLTIEMLMLKEEHRIIRTDRRAQQSISIKSIGREDYAQSRYMCEDRFTALAMIDSTAFQITAYRHAHNRRTGESIIRAPTQ